MKKFVLDTNLYICAFRSSEQAVALERFSAAFTPHCYLSSVVLHELLVGAKTPAKARQIHQEIARPFKRRERLVAPSHRNWEESAEALARLAREENIELKTIPKSLVHDALLAASWQEAGLILVTDNQEDFVRLRRFLRIAFVAPGRSEPRRGACHMPVSNKRLKELAVIASGRLSQWGESLPDAPADTPQKCIRNCVRQTGYLFLTHPPS